MENEENQPSTSQRLRPKRKSTGYQENSPPPLLPVEVTHEDHEEINVLPEKKTDSSDSESISVGKTGLTFGYSKVYSGENGSKVYLFSTYTSDIGTASSEGELVITSPESIEDTIVNIFDALPSKSVLQFTQLILI